MASWIYVFSRFTPEALLFEALMICVLCASYAAFWVLRKRKHGVLGLHAPSGVVKGYLNVMIADAEQMRAQLFGLLAGNGSMSTAGDAAYRSSLHVMPMTGAPSPSAAALAADPDVMNKIIAMEARMAEQARAMEAILADKARLETELAAARAGKGGAGAAAGGDNSKLQEKINALEGKLAEYSVIEDDLANLKRLQQENTQLKSQLSGKAGAPATASAAKATTEAAKGTSASTPASAEAGFPEPGADSAENSMAGAEAGANALGTDPSGALPTEPNLDAAATELEAPPAAEAAPFAEPIAQSEPPAGATSDAAFEGLVDQVEKSLADPSAAAGTAEAALEAATAVATPAMVPPSSASGQKSDADLVAEFEKMLNS